jgi:glyoxylase-like metal-dependent hydrolase (beta-lactamase superfamily II)
MLVERSMHPRWLSNAFMVAAERGGTAVFVDSGAPIEPLLDAVTRYRVKPVRLLITHGHEDHVIGNDEILREHPVEVSQESVETEDLHVEALPTPGHSDDGVSYVVNRKLVLSGDTLFKNAVGGGNAEQVRHSVMEVLMKLPHELRVLPGHTDPTTIGREWEENPFVLYWRGVAGEDGRRCRVGEREGTVVVWSPDYDTKGKLLVRFDDGGEVIVGASRAEIF